MPLRRRGWRNSSETNKKESDEEEFSKIVLFEAQKSSTSHFLFAFSLLSPISSRESLSQSEQRFWDRVSRPQRRRRKWRLETAPAREPEIMSQSERGRDVNGISSVNDGVMQDRPTAQQPSAALTQAGRFLVLDRDERVSDGEPKRRSRLPGRAARGPGAAPSRLGVDSHTRNDKEKSSPLFSLSLSLSLPLSLFLFPSLSPILTRAPSPPFSLTPTTQTSAVAGGRPKRRVSLPKEKKGGAFFFFFRGQRERSRCFFTFDTFVPFLLLLPSVPFASILRAPLDTLRSLE